MDMVNRISTTANVDELNHLYNVASSKNTTDNAGNIYKTFSGLDIHTYMYYAIVAE